MINDLRFVSARPEPRSRAAWAIVALLATFAAACSPAVAPSTRPGGSDGPAGSPAPTIAPTPSPTAVAGGIQHSAGATDVLLRFEQAGGFAPIEFLATNAPSFTLYGDGTVVFRDPGAIPPAPAGNVHRSTPFQTVRLGEAGIQALLRDAIGPGGLGVAVGPYMGLGADIPTSTFTISADGETKTVSVVGLMPEMHPQNALIVASLARFAERLGGFGSGIAGERPYIPGAYRGTLIPVDQPLGPVVAWPWSNLKPADFKGGENEFFLTRTMTPAEVASLGIPGAEGGLQGVSLQGAGKLYTLALRPLLPDESS